MATNKITPEELWARQQISPLDVDYDLWNERRASIQTFSRMSQSCIFTVDVFKERYDFASDNFATIFGYNPTWIKTIQKQGNLLEERIHPDDRAQLIEHQIEHGQFIYSLPQEQRNDYQQIFQIRMLNARQEYVNVISRHQVIQKDKNGKPCRINKSISFSRLVNCWLAGTTADGSISPVFRFITVRLIRSIGVWSGAMSITPIIIHAFPFLSF